MMKALKYSGLILAGLLLDFFCILGVVVVLGGGYGSGAYFRCSGYGVVRLSAFLSVQNNPKGLEHNHYLVYDRGAAASDSCRSLFAYSGHL